MKKENYIHIHNWMLTDLKLSGNELLIYAVVFGFSKDGVNIYYAKIETLQNQLNISKQTCINCLNSLVNKNLITREKREIGKTSIYRAVINESSTDFVPASTESVPAQVQILDSKPSTDFVPNNTLKKNNILKEKKNNETAVFFESLFQLYKTLTTVSSHKSKSLEYFKKLNPNQIVSIELYLKEYSGRAAKIRSAGGWLANLPAFERFLRDKVWENKDLPEVKTQQAKPTHIPNFL